MTYRKKLIEVALPLEDINREAAREKSIRHGHPSTLHLWWARRPLAACRAVLFSSLVDDPSECVAELMADAAKRRALGKRQQFERGKGFQRRDVSQEDCGYDIESRGPITDRLRFLEVEGRVKGAETVTVTKNEILNGLNRPDSYILAIVFVEGGVAETPAYLRRPFSQEPEFAAASVNLKLSELFEKVVKEMEN